jgi:hypothetical protein
VLRGNTSTSIDFKPIELLTIKSPATFDAIARLSVKGVTILEVERCSESSTTIGSGCEPYSRAFGQRGKRSL